jgi:WD40 repeat protein
LKGNKKYINSISFSPDGKYLASAGLDKVLRVYNLKTKKC